MTARVTFRVAACHPPPQRAPIARAIYVARFAAVRSRFKGGDMNLTAVLASRALRRKVVGSGVLYLSIPRRYWRTVDHKSVDVGSDHDAELITVKHVPTGRTVVFLILNCAGYSFDTIRSRLIMRAGIELQADVILGSECIRFRADSVKGSGDYQWAQFGDVGQAQSGVLIGARNKVAALTDCQRIVGSKATREGGGIDERSIVRGRVTLINHDKENR